MYQRDDGIVEFDPDVCIGCKACLQACPYDAIYVDPEDGTAAKCHYCAHRVELNLEPACVVVCPEHAIIAGDMDDPLSEISKMLAANEVTVRKPEQGTAPKLFYVDGNDVNLTPTAVETPATYAWADAPAGGDGYSAPPNQGHAQGVPDGPVMIGKGVMADQMVQATYNVQHKMPWHWPVPAYLVTKGIGAGAMLLFAAAFFLGKATVDGLMSLSAGFIATVFTAITSILLIYDLERPERFLRILFRPQMKSWLTRGAFILIAFATLSTLWTGYVLAVRAGVMESTTLVTSVLLYLSVPLAIGTAIYTAFLFGQAEGRDLWQSSLLPFHLFVQAILAGAAVLYLVLVLFSGSPDMLSMTRMVLLVALVLDLCLTLMGEFAMPHASEVAARAAKMISSGRYSQIFWVGAIVAGHVLPFILLLTPLPTLSVAAALLSIVGLYAYEFAFVMAPQRIPNS